MPSVTVYSQPSCVQCNATYTTLNAHDLDYEVIDITDDDEAREFATGLGHMRLPVVVIRDENGIIDEHWSGFNPDRIAEVSQTPDAVPVAA